MTFMSSPTYNDRLFKRGLRKYWHSARFYWLQRVWEEFGPVSPSVMELGCFDGKTLDFLPPLGSYTGYDAGWGGGLDLAIANRTAPGISFQQAQSPDDLSGTYDAIICMETIEHVPLRYTEAFIAKFAEMAPLLFVTVPMELGPLAVVKHAYKSITKNRPDDYRYSELLAMLVGHSRGIEREEGGHKGFDYRDVVAIVRRHFANVRVESIPFRSAPAPFGSAVGMIATR
jgi:hypothetical protein